LFRFQDDFWRKKGKERSEGRHNQGKKGRRKKRKSALRGTRPLIERFERVVREKKRGGREGGCGFDFKSV